MYKNKVPGEKDYYKTAFNILADLVWLKDRDGVFLRCNDAVTRMVGLKKSEIIGKTDYDIFEKNRADYFRKFDLSAMEDNKTIKNLEYLSAADGSFQGYFETKKTPMKDKNGNIIGVLGVARDVNDAILKERKLEKLSKYDNLTTLKNRTTFVSDVAISIKGKIKNQSHALLFIDLDRFKEINDTMGHNVGDKLLSMVAQRLKKLSAQGEKNSRILARFGGDEFTMLIKNIKDKSEASKIAQDVVNALRKPFFIDNYEFYITSSVGIAIHPEDATSVENLLKYADSAMYEAKNGGKDDYRFYSKYLLEENIKKVSLINDLRRAIKNKEFKLYYQAQFDALNKSIVGAEALIRWFHPEKGLISPADFIPMAENSGQIVEIGKWVIKQAMQDMAEWKRNGYVIDKISINLSPRQLNDKYLYKMIKESLNETECKAEWIEFEITESYAMSDPLSSIMLLQRLVDLGFTFSLDDFGTGYSSLAYLKKLPIHKLKIDQSFISDILINNNNKAIVDAVIFIAKSMELDVIAEGVETQEQQDILITQKCNLTQGYLYSKPIEKEKFVSDFFVNN